VKIFISANGPTIDASVGQRFGLSPYFIIVNPQTMEFESVPNSGANGERSAGIRAVVLAIGKEVDMVLTGYCSPTATKYLSDNGIDVVTGVEGTVAEAVAQYKKQLHVITRQGQEKPVVADAPLMHALKSSGRQLMNMLPVFVGVVLLVGLFTALISKELLSSIFTGNALLDTLSGTALGCILAGNPINSYVIGGQMLVRGVSLYAVTAFIVAWVTIGLVQLPAEMAALGTKFALIRNALSVVLCLFISILTVVIYRAIAGP